MAGHAHVLRGSRKRHVQLNNNDPHCPHDLGLFLSSCNISGIKQRYHITQPEQRRRNELVNDWFCFAGKVIMSSSASVQNLEEAATIASEYISSQSVICKHEMNC